MELEIIARVHTDFPTKFGLPRQSGLAALPAEIVFEPPFRDASCIRGIGGWSHLWLIWQFDRAVASGWAPTVAPPKLGGKERVGVFATRSPFRPNFMGLSCVRLEQVEEHTPRGPVLHVSGADLADGTPIFDIKPYLPYADSVPGAADAFADKRRGGLLQVDFPDQWLALIPEDKRAALLQVLALDARPGYQDDPARRYGFPYAGFDVRFTVAEGRLTVVEVVRL
ncbi:MAG: tRNA (N6-threonylcarbamoyladenosine(37)-N6)-methyltransferase TrmO [Clostridia bacterium]|nr:tRNA (N6-threonylcarbamoyladenosine(37)-N6)-methyltransferase TrmO [Clostridia bacterium]